MSLCELKFGSLPICAMGLRAGN